MQAPTPMKGMALPDEEYEKIEHILKKKTNIRLTNTAGVEVNFFFKDKVLYGEHKDHTVEEVFKLSTVQQQQQRDDPNSFRNLVKARMTAEQPDWSEEKIELNADIISEANESVRRLVDMGVEYKVAVAIVKHTLKSKDIEEEINDIRELLKERADEMQ